MIFAVSFPFLYDLVVLFVISVVIAYVCYRFNLLPIVGFLIAGIIIGPHAMGLVKDIELVNTLAEVGIILLLFTIGIEFSLEKLNHIRRAIFIGGGLQVAGITAIVTAILSLFGLPWQTGIYTGFLIALSSTAIILGILSDKEQTDTPAGQLSLGVLIFQDLAIIIMVLLIPFLAEDSGTQTNILWALGKAFLIIVGVLLLARRVVPWLLEKVAHTRRQELFLLTVIAICFGTAGLTNLAGVSLALGAFLGGLVVSESYYSEQAVSEILPLRTIFTAVFFVSIGMLLNVNYLVNHPVLIILSALIVLALKFIINTTSFVILGRPIRIAAASGLILAQISEFSFVLERAGNSLGLSPAGLGDAGSQTFIAVTVLLMIASPFLFSAAPGMGNLFASLFSGRAETKKTLHEKDAESIEDHVIIVGYGPAGRYLVKALRDSGIPFVVIEMNPQSVKEMKQQDLPVIYGDAGQTHILNSAVIKKAKLLVIATNDPTSSPLILKRARQINPTLQIILRARYLNQVERLEQQGADIVVPEELETTVRLFRHVLGAYLIPEQEIERQVNNLRADDYQIMRGSVQEAHLMVLKGLDDEGLHTRVVKVREQSPATGKTLEELQLRKKYGITVLTI
ncbi:MAG TPA: cation:proton antiporter, partial [Balneolaceae bacterium]|nr:cation:proton antiporter [Balneolaceae bacterium]